MKKIRDLSEGSFLKLLFAFITLAFFVASFCMPDLDTLFSGLWKITISTNKVTTNFFAIGGYAATFFNMALVGLVCLLLYVIFGSTPNNVSNLAFILTVGFGAWSVNMINIWFGILGVIVYGLVKKEKLGSLVNAMIFTTGLTPIISDMLFRFPHTEYVGFRPEGLLMALAVGLFIGFCLPGGMAHSPSVHKGYDLYSAALPMGMIAFFLQAVLFKTMGVTIPGASTPEEMAVVSPMIVNVFCCVLFVLCILFALLLGCKPKDYWHLLTDPAYVNNFSSTYGNSVFLMNLGVYGLFILAYYNLVGAPFTSITFGVIFCMLSCCDSGSHPGNVWPIMLGYVLASLGARWFSGLCGGTFTAAAGSQAIVVGLCFANGLSPISDKYGWFYGMLAAMMHYFLVTSVPAMHGGFCLYNGGFTAALICMILIPVLEKVVRNKEEKRKLKAGK